MRITMLAINIIIAIVPTCGDGFIVKRYCQINIMTLASIDDIACMKLSAIASRGSRKDFIDLWFIIQQYRSLNEYIQLYKKNFKIGIYPTL
jgi:Domain of unknown function (DUF1814).